MEPEGPVRCLQQVATGTYPEWKNPVHILISCSLTIKLKIILYLYMYLPSDIFPYVFRLKFLCIFHVLRVYRISSFYFWWP